MGNWDQPGGMEAIDQVLTACESHPRIDSGHLLLAGLSNGALGVTRTLLCHPGRFRGAVYLSPVLEPDLATTETFFQAVSGTPLLLISGEGDRRVPTKYLRPTVAVWEKAGLDCAAHFVPDEDHFLVFSQWNETMEMIRSFAGWLPKSGNRTTLPPFPCGSF